MKIAPILRALQEKHETSKDLDLEWKLVHTGQHYDYEMSEAFFEDLEIPKPDFFLETGSASHAVQTANIMMAFEKVCMVEGPQIIIVVGDVNSTLACSIVAKKMMIQVAHVEAGLRSFDLSMPEEINRIVTDSISDYFFVTEESAVENLLREGKSSDHIFFVGHVMIDNLFFQLERLNNGEHGKSEYFDLKDQLKKYVFLTLHRPSNVDQKETLKDIVDAMNEVSATLPIVFPVHPRTKEALEKFDLEFNERVHLLPPLNFIDSLYLWKDAVVVLTDSGGLQEETTALGVPCITLRENTERPITIELGTNCLAGNKKEDILHSFRRNLGRAKRTNSIPPKWDGKTAERIVQILTSEL